MIDFEHAVPSLLDADASDRYERDPGTFFASQVGFCPRQLYVNKLGLAERGTRRGKYRVARLIQGYLEERLDDRNPHLETGASLRVNGDMVRFVGRCSALDRGEGVAYALKVRNGWHKFSPPVDRHLDQLHVYMEGLGVDRGKLVYVSKNDLGDIREWPDATADDDAIAFDADRYERVVAKARRVRDEVWANGIATAPTEIPFPKCGCYFCQQETLDFSDVSAATPDAADPDASATASRAERGADHEANCPVVDDVRPSVETVSSETRVLETDGKHVPKELRKLDLWVLWDGREKVALAPWQEDTMYPCEWAAAKDVDPRRQFEASRMVAELPVEELHRTWPFPNSDDLPEAVHPAVLLRHDPTPPPVAFVDFDDVRDPTTGEVPAEVADLVDAFGGYTEVSRSGTGLHVYVRGALPDGVGAFAAPLDVRGSIEVYDHARFTGGTWHHVTGTPMDAVPKAGDVLAETIARYGTVSTPT